MTQATWAAAAPALSRTRSHVRGDGLELPRTFFYLGTATLGILTLRPLGGLALSDLFFFAAFALAIASQLLSRTSLGHLDHRMVLGGVLYAIGSLASAFGNENSMLSLDVVVRLLFLVTGWFWLATALLRTSDQIRFAITLWVLSIAASGIAAMVQLLAGDVVPGSHPAWGRMTGLTGQPNDLGGESAVALVAASTLAISGTGERFRVLLLMGAIACLGGLLLSGSVSGFLAAATTGGAMAFLYLPPARKILLVGFVSLLCALVFVLQDEFDSATPSSRIESTTADEGSFFSRAEIYETAIGRIASNPLLGVGPQPGGTTIGGATVISREGKVHNAALATWYESGILGLTGLLVISGSAITTSLFAMKNSDPQDRRMAVALAFAFACYLLFGLAQPVLYVRFGWIPIALISALAWKNIREGSGQTVVQTGTARSFRRPLRFA